MWPRFLFRYLSLSGLAFCLWPIVAWGHGDGHERILRLTEQIALKPTDASLYHQRGELHRQHQLFDEALSDVEHAQRLSPTNTFLDLLKAKTLHDAAFPKAAFAVVQRFNTNFPHFVEGWLVRGRVLLKMEQPIQSVAAFTAAIELPQGDKPDYYVERAEVLIALGALHWDEALKGLEQGIQRLGKLITLQMKALEVELASEQYEAAVQRIDEMMKPMARKESWLTQKGEVLLKLGRKGEAESAFREALASLDLLPPARRNVKATQELEVKLKKLLGAGAQ